jgi:hypothetical protein
MNDLAPILLFVYNRPEHTRLTLEALKANILADQSQLFIYADAARNEKDRLSVDEVRKIIHSIDGFAKISLCIREQNFGLANNIIDGVTKIVNQYGKVIVLEDDLITAPHFLEFMNDGLETYKDEEKMGHIHACQYYMTDALPETFLLRFVGSWGWATWDRAWKSFNPDGAALLRELEEKKLTKYFDFNNAYGFTRMLRRQVKGLNHSWAIRWNASLFLNGLYSLNVGKTLVQNIGLDGSGTNCGAGVKMGKDLFNGRIPVVKAENIIEDMKARQLVEEYYRKTYSFKAKAIRRIKRTLKGDFGA